MKPNRCLLLAVILLLLGCTRGDMINVAKIAVTGDAVSAGKLATRKAVGYAINPKALERDIRNFETRFAALADQFRKAVEQIWGKKEIQVPKPKKYVKYTQNYLSRALVDFDRGLITVETLDSKTPLVSLKNAVATTLLSPNDPRAVDLYSAKPVKLGETPFLYNEVRDHQGKPIRWPWRAERFADYLIKNRLKHRESGTRNATTRIHFVSILMVKDHLEIRAKKYQPLIERFAGRFSISRNLVYAIMKTESDFNPYAVSKAPAFGLMQIVPATAGRDVNIFLNKKGLPSDQLPLCAGKQHSIRNRLSAPADDPISRPDNKPNILGILRNRGLQYRRRKRAAHLRSQPREGPARNQSAEPFRGLQYPEGKAPLR